MPPGVRSYVVASCPTLLVCEASVTTSRQIIRAALVGLCISAGLGAQSVPPAETQASLAPATKLEAFRPAAGSVVMLGFDDLGRVNGVSVSMRELREAKGTSVRGVLVEVYESQYRQAQSFVDADEIPELLKGFDALLDVKANPTKFKNFEARYTTRGELRLTAFSSNSGRILFAVRAGRTVAAEQVSIVESDMQKIRAMFAAASARLADLSSEK